MNNILIKNYPAPPINTKEVLRYAGGGNDENTIKLLQKQFARLKEAIDEINKLVEENGGLTK